jgi:hypothetical protein
LISESEESDANIAPFSTGSINKDGGTGTYTKPSADLKANAMECSVVGEKRDDHAEKKCENEDNINRAGKGGVVDKGGNGE